MIINPKFLFILLIFSICSCTQDINEDSIVHGKAIAIIDGDTFDLVVKNEQIRIRLSAIDCPERGQAYYKKAKQYLAVLIFQKEVKVKLLKKDSFGKRWIGDVYINDTTNVNRLMVKNGLAWHFKRYSNDVEFEKLEKSAIKYKINIWSDSNSIAPWNFRKNKKRTNG